MPPLCSGCGGRFDTRDKFERLSKIQESRTKADETKGDTGTILVVRCNYCILTHSLYLCNDETTIQRATNKIPEGRNGDRLKLSVDHTIKEVKRAKEARKPKDPPLLDKTNQTTKGVKRAKKAKKPKGPPLLDDKTKQACKILNRALPDFVKNGKGRDYMAKNPGCSAYDFIFERISPSMICSVLKSCAPEFMKARGLHDVEEKCQCSRGCKHILPTEESERSFLPVLKGSPIPVAKCCLYTLIWNDDPRIPTSLAKEKKSVKGGMVAYNENNPKGPTAVQLCKQGNIYPLEGFFSSPRQAEKLGGIQKAKERLGFYLQDKKKDNSRSSFSSRKTDEDRRLQNREIAKTARQTAHYNCPDEMFKRTMRSRRGQVMRGVLGNESPLTLLLLNATNGFVNGFMLQYAIMFLLEDGVDVSSKEELDKELEIKTQGDEIVPMNSLEDYAIMLSLMNFQFSPGTVNQKKYTYTTKECVEILIELIKIFNVLHYKQVQTKEQGMQFAKDNRERLKKLFDESNKFRTTDINKVEWITKNEVTRIISKAGLPKLELSLTSKPWNDLSEEEQRIHRLNGYKAAEKYFNQWNRYGYGATRSRELIKEMEEDEKKPAAISSKKSSSTSSSKKSSSTSSSKKSSSTSSSKKSSSTISGWMSSSTSSSKKSRFKTTTATSKTSATRKRKFTSTSVSKKKAKKGFLDDSDEEFLEDSSVESHFDEDKMLGDDESIVSMPDRDRWICSTCTYANEKKHSRCKMCNTFRE